ncbi:uncharacterized protein C17orf114 homolog [Vipera latastei]
MERAKGEAAASRPFPEGGGWEVFGHVGPAPPELGAAPKVARIVPRVRETRHKHPSVAGGGERAGGPSSPGAMPLPGAAAALGQPPPSARPLPVIARSRLLRSSPQTGRDKKEAAWNGSARTSSAPLAPPSPSGPSRMGSRFPSCFPRARRGRSWRAGKTGQGESPEASADDGPDVAAGRARSTPSTSSEGDPQSGRAYFSGKARVSFRHQLDSERDSTS